MFIFQWVENAAIGSMETVLSSKKSKLLRCWWTAGCGTAGSAGKAGDWAMASEEKLKVSRSQKQWSFCVIWKVNIKSFHLCLQNGKTLMDFERVKIWYNLNFEKIVLDVFVRNSLKVSKIESIKPLREYGYYSGRRWGRVDHGYSVDVLVSAGLWLCLENRASRLCW